MNTAKIQAIELRETGLSVRAVAARTGLSVPTVVALHKAFLSGGMTAVLARKPGRPRRPQGDFVDGMHEPKALVGLRPEVLSDASGQAHALWTLPLLAQWLESQRKKPVNARAAARLWRQWGWAPTWPETRMTDAWQAQVHGPLRGGGWMLCCRSPKHSVYWLTLDGLPMARDYLDWFARLLRLQPEGVVLQLHLPGIHFIEGLAAWLALHPQFQLRLTQTSSPCEKEDPMTPTPAQTGPTLVGLTHDPDPVDRLIQNRLTHLQKLESQSIHILREVAATCRHPVMLYSIGKDSACMLHLALKAFSPGRLPFPLLHVDTGWKFKDMYAFRSRMQQAHGFELLVHQNKEGMAQGINPFTHGSQIHTDVMKTQALRQALDKHRFDAAFGGARRDEEKSRAKERVFSFRTRDHHWDPKNQRPELWNLYNSFIGPEESLRVFPLSNWTELDIWLYIHQENIPVVPLYFAKARPVVERHGTLIMVDDERMPLHPGEVPIMREVRFRTLGCYPLTGAIESNAQTVPDIIREMLVSRTSERQGRLIDHDGAASMEKKKQEGYF